MKQKFLLTLVVLLCLLTPAWAGIADDVATAAAGIEVYKESCGPLPPRFQTIYDFLNSLHGTPADEYALHLAIVEARQELERTGKATWCQQMQLRAVL